MGEYKSDHQGLTEGDAETRWAGQSIPASETCMGYGTHALSETGYRTWQSEELGGPLASRVPIGYCLDLPGLPLQTMPSHPRDNILLGDHK